MQMFSQIFPFRHLATLVWSQSYGAPEGTRKLKSFKWLDCTNNKVLNVAIAQTIKFRMSRLHKQ